MAKRRPQRSYAPSTKLRNGLFRLCGQAPEHGGNLWLVHSTRNHQQWIINGDLKFLHFLYLEFEPSVLGFEIRPAAVAATIDEVTEHVTFDAVVRFTDGRTECRMVGTSEHTPQQDLAASRCGGVTQLVSVDDLYPVRNRILNGLRMNRFLTAARHHPLEADCNAVLVSLKRSQAAVTLEELCTRLHHIHAAFAQAAVFRLYQLRRVDLDLNAGPLHRHSLVGIRQ
ncbi:MAG: hypothetical protein ABIR16_03195 [Dokdonella sp.]